MFEDRFAEFALELLRALLVDELSGHVRRGITRLFVARKPHDFHRIIWNIHRHNRSRLLHRIFTELDDDL